MCIARLVVQLLGALFGCIRVAFGNVSMFNLVDNSILTFSVFRLIRKFLSILYMLFMQASRH